MIFIIESFFYVLKGGGFEFAESVCCNVDEVGKWWQGNFSACEIGNNAECSDGVI
jgi:hypothetical protein